MSVGYMHQFIIIVAYTFTALIHSHKKWKDSLEGNLNRVLSAIETEFPKIIVPMVRQHTSNVNNECAGKSKQMYSLYMISFLEH